MPLNREMFIQQLQESVGPNYRGQEILKEIKQLLSSHITATTLTDLCAKSLVMALIMADSQQPSPCKPTSPSQSLSDSSPSTSTRFRLIYDGINGPTINFNEWDILSRLLEERGGSLGVEMIDRKSTRLNS